MPENKITELLGQPLQHPDMQAALDAMGIANEPEDSIGWVEIKDEKQGIFLEFRNRNSMLFYHGEPLSSFGGKNEVFFYEMTFDNDFGTKKRQFAFDLPYKLMLGDDGETVARKIGAKPHEKITGTDYSFGWWFVKDDAEILTAFDESMKLLWCRIMLISKSKKKNRELKASFKEINKKLTVPPKEAIAAIMPTDKWRRRMHEGEATFTNENVTVAELVLGTFGEQLINAARDKKAANIYTTVKKTIKALNGLNKKHGSFIETTEREELVDFITQALGLAGYNIEVGHDITEEWREW